ncbi:MAG: flagellin [Bacteriovoracaceae bacterium]
MGLRINTNVTSLSAQRVLSNKNQEQSDTLGKLSSGTRIVRASDDAAGLAISEKLRGEIRSVNQANRNANDGISLIQVSEGALNESSGILIRLRELAMQSSTDTLGDQERGFVDKEYQNLKLEIQRISQSTSFNGKKLLNGEGTAYDFQVGIHNNNFEDRITYNAAMTNSSVDALGMAEESVATKEAAQASLAKTDLALSKISGQRAELGAIQNRLVSTSQNLQVMGENLNAANARIRDTDYAEATAQNTKLNILTNAGTAVLAQANMQGGNATKLLG